MRTAERRRLAGALGFSVLAHAAFFVWLVSFSPTPPTRYDVRDDLPERFVPVIILPRKLIEPKPEKDRPTPVRPRMARLPPTTSPVPPLVVPAAPPSVAPARPAAPRLAPQVSGGIRQALRESHVGCANDDRVGLNIREREKCDERFGKGAKTAAFIPPSVDAGIRAAGARKEAIIRAREAPLGPGNLGPFVKPSDHSGEPPIAGAGASAIGAASHPTSRRAAQKLERMR